MIQTKIPQHVQLRQERHFPMAANRIAPDADEPKSPWPGYLQFVVVVVVTVMFFLLALSMKRHHFFDGSQNARIHASQQ